MRELAARVEGVRRTNLGEILRLVHHNGALSRAQITALTGLNRSTVADLVGALTQQDILAEGNPNPTRRVGRPSPMVSPSDSIVALALNPEVDAIEVAVVGLGGRVLRRARRVVDAIPTPEETIAVTREIVEEWRREELASTRVIGLGAAIPGLVRESDGVVRFAPHLGWREENFGAALTEALELPVTVGNDASLGALAEWIFGAARDHEHIVYLNGGASGIGGGLIVHGRLVSGAGGYAGEWGQNAPSVNDSALRTQDGVLEDEVNRTRLVGLVRLDAPDDSELAQALTATNDAIQSEVQRQQLVLAGALANAINALNPSRIVLGGFLAILHDADPVRLREYVARYSMRVPMENVTIRAAELGADRLHIGAAEAAFASLLADPMR